MNSNCRKSYITTAPCSFRFAASLGMGHDGSLTYYITVYHSRLLIRTSWKRNLSRAVRIWLCCCFALNQTISGRLYY